MTSHAPSFYFPAPRAQKFCSQCGSATTHRVPPDDTHERDVCEQCGAVHYQNPRNVVGVVPVWGEKILLCKRAIEPRYGKWTLPAGFMELGETTAQGASRETAEEAGAQIELGPRSEEHTSELQSLMRISYAVFCLKKKKDTKLRIKKQ